MDPRARFDDSRVVWSGAPTVAPCASIANEEGGIEERSRRVLTLLAVLLAGVVSVVPAAAQDPDRGPVSPDSAAVLRAGMERPPAEHGLTLGEVVNAPLRLVGIPLAWAFEGTLFAVQVVREVPPLFGRLARYDLYPSITTDLGPRSGIGLALRYEGLSPLELETAYAISASQRHAATLRLGRTAEVVGYFRRHAQEKFWGIGPDSREADGADFRWDQWGGVARGSVPAGAFTLSAGVGVEENSVGRGGDGSVDDLQDVFDVSELFGAREDTRFLRAELGAALDLLDRGTLRITGARLEARTERFEGRDGTASDFTRLRVSGAALVPAGLRHTLAFTGRVELTRDATEEIPFTHLPSLGGGPGLRAYDSGRFRDRDLFALGSELRYEVWRDLRERGRAEGYVFWEEGGVGPSLDDIPETYSSYGFGLLLVWTGQVLGDAYLAFGDDGARVSASVSLGSFR